MELFAKKDKRSAAEKEYDEAMKVLGTCIPGTEDYEAQFDICERLHKMVIEESSHSGKISKDTIATCLCSVFGVTVCAYRDYLHPITTKAMNFVMKGRVR